MAKSNLNGKCCKKDECLRRKGVSIGEDIQW